ncbi:gamma-glutamylcyclotransferase-like [Gigantopelta aegis]|uniref:gamma-glutamylcyclotransferase-like n=1 Tax=Gigantopelta aegis TaxID=1735272 RepID=UPI001B88CF9F|nr:gamma-glutamylcyclotransferase-like [Gigantopelta aegis]
MIVCCGRNHSYICLEASMSDTFLYFGYGSNLLKQRLLLRNPSADFHCVARLKDYRLTMVKPPPYQPHVHSWNGGLASIEPHPGSDVWGVVWQLDAKDRTSLDQQEDYYTGHDVTVQDETGREHVCRTYQLEGRSSERPSPQYKDVIVRGAKQNGLPADYITGLEQMEDNGFVGHMQLYEDALKLLGD